MAEDYGSKDVQDFVDALAKVLNLDRFDLDTRKPVGGPCDAMMAG